MLPLVESAFFLVNKCISASLPRAECHQTQCTRAQRCLICGCKTHIWTGDQTCLRIIALQWHYPSLSAYAAACAIKGGRNNTERRGKKTRRQVIYLIRIGYLFGWVVCLTLSLSDRDIGRERWLGLVSPYLPILCSLSSSLPQLSLGCTDFVFIRKYSIEMLMSKIYPPRSVSLSLRSICISNLALFSRLQFFLSLSLSVVCRHFIVVCSRSSYSMFARCIFLFVHHFINKNDDDDDAIERNDWEWNKNENGARESICVLRPSTDIFRVLTIIAIILLPVISARSASSAFLIDKNAPLVWATAHNCDQQMRQRQIKRNAEVLRAQNTQSH